jgi:predicted TIM-barrel fold metal-dependent hydrolase
MNGSTWSGKAAGRIDVHHHFNAPGGRGGQANWSPQRAIEEMDGAGIAAAVGWPGPVSTGNVASDRERARFINEFGAGVVASYPTRFGLFASAPPLSDVDGALNEITFALDELGADGIGLITHYGNAWLGDPAFRPVFEELDRRSAVVFVHPHAGGGSGIPGKPLGYQVQPITDSWLEYPFNTARTILSLIATGTLRAFPRIRFIFCHGGGAFTPLVKRITGFNNWFQIGQEKLDEIFPKDWKPSFSACTLNAHRRTSLRTWRCSEASCRLRRSCSEATMTAFP